MIPISIVIFGAAFVKTTSLQYLLRDHLSRLLVRRQRTVGIVDRGRFDNEKSDLEIGA